MATCTNDSALFVDISSGSTAALVQLYDRYSPYLLALAQAIVGVGNEAEEAVHDVFLTLWRSPSCYKAKLGTLKSWLTLETRNIALHMLHTMPEILPQLGDIASFNMHAATYETNSNITHQRQLVQQTMSKLTPQQQRILELTYFAAMPPESIAKTLNMPIESVDESITMIRYALWHLLDD